MDDIVLAQPPAWGSCQKRRPIRTVHDRFGRHAITCPARVLVIEDDPSTRDMMAILLTLEGFDPTVACHGPDALDQLHVPPLPHVILLDLMMPMMNGWDFRRHQRRDPTIAQIPVIVVSAAPQSTLQGLQPVAVLPKPLDYDRLISVVRANC